MLCHMLHIIFFKRYLKSIKSHKMNPKILQCCTKPNSVSHASIIKVKNICTTASFSFIDWIRLSLSHSEIKIKKKWFNNLFRSFDYYSMPNVMRNKSFQLS
ncbi:hypothetical protein ACKWTF_003814 [Chironomus riparius]